MKQTWEMLGEWVDERTTYALYCSSCSDCSEIESYDDSAAMQYWYKNGWRGTKSNCYCPACAKKKLKQNQ